MVIWIIKGLCTATKMVSIQSVVQNVKTVSFCNLFMCLLFLAGFKIFQVSPGYRTQVVEESVSLLPTAETSEGGALFFCKPNFV